MRILVIADGRSPITRNWVGDLVESGHEVVVVSSFPHQSIPGLKAEYTLPICFSRFAGSQIQQSRQQESASPEPSFFQRLIQNYRGTFQQLRYWLGPLTFPRYRRQLKKILAHHVFDLVHVRGIVRRARSR